MKYDTTWQATTLHENCQNDLVLLFIIVFLIIKLFYQKTAIVKRRLFAISVSHDTKCYVREILDAIGTTIKAHKEYLYIPDLREKSDMLICLENSRY